MTKVVLERSENLQIHSEVVEYQGKTGLDLRTKYRKGNDWLRGKGVRIPIEHAEKFLTDTLEMLRNN